MIAIIAILAAILFPVFAKAREKARQATCASNLKQIGLAVAQYVQDSDEMYPDGYDPNDPHDSQTFSGYPTLEEKFPVLLQTYLKSAAVFKCPDDPTQNGGYYDAPGNNHTCCGAYPPPIPFSYQYSFCFFHGQGQFREGSSCQTSPDIGPGPAPASLSQVNYPAQKVIVSCMENKTHFPDGDHLLYLFTDGHVKAVSAASVNPDNTCAPGNFDWTVGGVGGVDVK